ncbi:MAG TPA: hypothetical protein VJ252_06195 [Chthoniobacterales bacterium]|nr:hypothetical protein [Chthoniobacterales bacterium]
MSLRSQIVVFVVATIAVAGCSNPNPTTAAAGGKSFAVTAESTGFYLYGPQQGNGADKQLEKGTLVSLIRPSFGYCKVKLTTGESGYVSNEDIGLASPALIAAANAPVHSSSSGRFRLDSSDPRLVPPPEPLPDFFPEPTPIPEPSPSGQ